MAYIILPYPALPSAYQPGGATPRRLDMIVLHATGGAKAGDLRTLSGRDRTHLVSAHYYITKLGEIYQLVQDRDIAWHAGISFWEGEGNCNNFSLGVELENWNNGVDRYPQAQIDAAVWLCREKVRAYGIRRTRLVRHSDVAPGRKQDPRNFPWESWKAQVFQNQPAPPPLPTPPLPQPGLDQQLRDALLDWAYRQVQHQYHPDWTLHQFARREQLGPPLLPSFNFAADNRTWVGEVYGVDAICAPMGQWQTVRRLSQLPAGALKNSLRVAAFGQIGVRYHAEWAQHQYADRTPLGPPLTENVRLVLPDGRVFGTQVWALDTLYSPDGQWGVVNTLGGLLAQELPELRSELLISALLNQQYQRVGSRYHPEWASHQYAVARNLGAPLGDQGSLTVRGQDYTVQAFARTLIFAPTGDWARIRRLEELG